jgi:translation initiation factor 4A
MTSLTIQESDVKKGDEIIPSKDYEIRSIESWDDLPEVKQVLLRGIYAHGFETPSPIQKKAIIPLFEGKDIIAQAQSGTGKTGCFTIGTLQRINTEFKTTQALIMTPTRELSHQIKKVLDAIGTMIPNITSQLLVGGTSTDMDSEQLTKNTPHVVIGCPGRVHDMMRRKRLQVKDLKLIVMDEADEMLSHGFKEQVYNIFQYLPTTVQVALFSATMPNEIAKLTEKFMNDPVKILVKSEQLTLEGIEQYYVALETDEHKYEALKDLYGVLSLSQSIIYCNSVRRVEELYEAMITDNFPVCRIHSNMDKNERQVSFNEFASGKMRVLISSNVTARGIDVQQVSTVINFDIPKCVNTYLHRIGRSGRWGRKGMGINFVTKRDIHSMKEIEQHYHTEIKELPANVVNTVEA